ncbi:MAG: GNAT family N-acetyltransferase [Granulosicoccus sp.]
MTLNQSTRDEHSTLKIQGSSYRMRPIEVSDADVVAAWYQQLDDVSIFDRQIPLPINPAEVLTLITSLVNDQKKDKCRWFITENAQGDAVGMAGLENINMLHGHAILPVFIAEPWRRTGVGIRMACMMIDLAFRQLRLNRVATIHRSDNTASEVLLDRLGFKKEGISRQCWFSHGRYFDLMNVSILVDEWNQIRVKLLAELSTDIIVELGPRPSTDWCWPERN